jgi:uncharacterized protein with HEPN domain
MIKDNTLFLTHILDSIEAIEDFVKDIHSKEEFTVSRKTKDAVLRNFEIIGEAANNLDEEFITSHPEISWAEIVAMRNMIIHEYFGVDMNLVWDTIIEDLPPFKVQIKVLLKQ